MTEQSEGKRRANGEGSYYELPDGRWAAEIMLTLSNGRRSRVKREAKTREEAARKLEQRISEIKSKEETRGSGKPTGETWNTRILRSLKLSRSPLSSAEIRNDLGIKDDAQVRMLGVYISKLNTSGAISRTEDGKYYLPETVKGLDSVNDEQLRRIVRLVLLEQKRQEPLHVTQQKLVSNWLDSLIRARDSGDPDQIAATVDEVIDAMSDLLF
jgi:hypothetical protein